MKDVIMLGIGIALGALLMKMKRDKDAAEAKVAA